MSERNGTVRAILRPPRADPPATASPAGPRPHLAALLGRILLTCDTRPLASPTLPPDLPELAALPRVVECLRYSLLDAEYALSPYGELRGVAKLALRAALVAGLLLLGLGLLLTGVALVAAVLEVIASRIETLLWHVLLCGLLALAIALVGAGLLGLVWTMLRGISRGR